jgi:uroporphyrin-III C-methyltransferase
MTRERFENDAPERAGKVLLVGAGPGDPGLLTLRGAEAIRDADVILYDALVGPEILGLASPDALLFFVGKRATMPSMSQEQINHLLVRNARRGRRVVRLKGGDPFVFGRGGEEVDALARAGVPFEVVPGVSSGTAAAAAAGVPLTHRDVASSVAFVTASESTDGAAPGVDWGALARAADTLVVFMCARSLRSLGERLRDAGLAPDTPVALVARASLSDQEVRRTTVGALERGDVSRIAAPALAIVGEVVAHAPFAQFEQEVDYVESVA